MGPPSFPDEFISTVHQRVHTVLRWLQKFLFPGLPSLHRWFSGEQYSHQYNRYSKQLGRLLYLDSKNTFHRQKRNDGMLHKLYP